MSPCELADLLLPLWMIPALALVHLFVHRIGSDRPLVESFFPAFAVTGTVLIAIEVANGIETGAGWDAVCRSIGDVIVFLGIAYAYMDFLAYGEASIRTRILDEVARSGESGLSIPELLARYNARIIGELRLKRLTSDAQLTLAGGRVFLGRRLAWQLGLAKVYRTFRRACGLPDEGVIEKNGTTKRSRDRSNAPRIPDHSNRESGQENGL